MRVVHIITGLGDGGAENILRKICEYDLDNKHIVISLQKPGKYSSLIKKMGIKVYHLNMKFFSILKFFKIIRLLNFLKPDIVQTWLVLGDLIGGIAAKLSGIKSIIWNVRYSKLTLENTSLINILLSRILIVLSYMIPKVIIVGSKSAKRNCENQGYCKQKLILIVNGYEPSIFKSDLSKRVSFRKKFDINNKVTVIGNVARYDKVKDHSGLLKALSIINSNKINFVCVLVGSEIDKNNFTLVKQIKNYNLNNKIKLIGIHRDIIQVMNGIDIYVQSSKYGEGFPNVVAEAMACKTPCVVTDSGDAPFIVSKTGWIVPPNNPKKLAKSIMKAIFQKNTSKWDKKCKVSQSRIKKNFPLDKMINNYQKLWLIVHGQNTKKH